MFGASEVIERLLREIEREPRKQGGKLTENPSGNWFSVVVPRAIEDSDEA